MSHSHSHGHSCSEEHAETPEEENARGQESLYRLIDKEKIRSFNAQNSEDAKVVIRPFEERKSKEGSVQSDDDDPELILFIPFTSAVNIKSITVTGGSTESSPKLLQCWINREDIDFSNVEDLPPVQEIELIQDVNAQPDAEYKTNITKFQRVENITLFFKETFGGDEQSTEIHYIGFRGEFDQIISREPIIATYEAKPMLQDHKLPSNNQPRMGM
eukprot:CAMPEP_0168584252 /NCGR_PEP_ID=MMETSP0420-20121227/3034_1 /TAXON_ID=498008 /ORGANISM="Pessonella sp." /LENGTH=215 /DNA_ID=CAMNT_0008619029 /DNA_START=8 /DNA_END=655 /DNA_ORIENTATION=-